MSPSCLTGCHSITAQMYSTLGSQDDFWISLFCSFRSFLLPMLGFFQAEPAVAHLRLRMSGAEPERDELVDRYAMCLHLPFCFTNEILEIRIIDLIRKRATVRIAVSVYGDCLEDHNPGAK